MTISQSEALRRVQSLDRIPTLPDVMCHVLAGLEDEASCAGDITEILAADPVITARILRLANSPFFGSRFEIDSIQRAVVTVGFEAVKQLALATAILDSLSARSQPCLNPEDFWMHSLGSAKAAQLLAFSTRRIAMPEPCFTGGLLHNLGKYILALSLQEEYSAVLEASASEGLPLASVERRLLRTDHCEVGGWLAGHWNLPPVIVAAVRHAGAPERYEGPFQQEVTIVSLSGDMARAARFGYGSDMPEVLFDEARVGALGLEVGQVGEICESLALMRNDARALLGMLRDPG